MFAILVTQSVLIFMLAAWSIYIYTIEIPLLKSELDFQEHVSDVQSEYIMTKLGHDKDCSIINDPSCDCGFHRLKYLSSDEDLTELI